MEELRKARIKRKDSLHLFVCPRLLRSEWFCQLYKKSDIVFCVPAGTWFRPALMTEPLIIGISFPFLSKPPWELRSKPKMFHPGRRLRGVWAEEDLDSGNLLRKFLLEYQRIRTMPADVVRRVLYFESKCPVPCEDLGRRRRRKRKQSAAPAVDEASMGKEASHPR
jgi:hypothetical protein